MAQCPGNPPPPAGTRVWRKAVPTALAQWAMDLRDHVAGFPYGQTWTTTYKGEVATARKDYHTWTYRKQSDGSVKLVTGICIPGITLYEPLPQGTGVVLGDLTNPDPSFALYGVDDTAAPEKTDWAVVGAAGAALVVVVGLFALALRQARVAAEVRRSDDRPRAR